MAATRPTRFDNLSLYAYENPMQFHGEQVASAINCKRYYRLHGRHIDLKRMAVGCFKSQLVGRENRLTGWNGIEMLAMLRGAEVGLEYAEMVMPIREVI